MTKPSPALMEMALELIRAHAEYRQEHDEPCNTYAIDEACELALNTPVDTAQEIAALHKMKEIFPNEGRTRRNDPA